MALLVSTAITSHGQTTTAQPDQRELVKQFFGTWHMQVSKDTIEVWEIKPFGKAYQHAIDYLIKGEKQPWRINNYVFLPKDNKFKGFQIFTNGSSSTWYAAFSSEKEYCIDMIHNFDPAALTGKYKFVLTSPETFTFYHLDLNGNVVREYHWKKVN
jgi:hypothetical protein